MVGGVLAYTRSMPREFLHAHAHVALPGSWHPGWYRVFGVAAMRCGVRCSELLRDRLAVRCRVHAL